MNRAAELRLNAESVERQLRRLAEQARDKLMDPTPELMAAVFDLLELDLVRIGDDHFEGTGSIPLPGDGGEVDLEVPQPLYRNLTAIRFGIEVAL